MLYVTRGYAACETTDAIDEAVALAERSGNLTQFVSWATRRWLGPFNSGDLPAASMLADQALELALREGSPRAIGMAHAVQTLTRHHHGDLAGADNQYTAGLKFFDDPGFRQVPGAALWTFSVASDNAWMLGRADVARERMARMMTAVNENNPHDVAISGIAAATLHDLLSEDKQAEALAARALELSEKNQFPPEAAYSRCALGRARMQLGRPTEGIELLRQGIASSLEGGLRLTIPAYTASLAEALGREGAIVEALATVEHALQANRDQLVNRPDIIRVRGELRLKAEQPELAEADFRDAIELAQKMGAKAWELRTTISLARLLAKHGRRDEARAMLAEIYGWFTEGFDTADLKGAKTLLDELSG